MSEEREVSMRASNKTAVIAWCLWLATVGFCAGGLVVTLVVTRPLTAGVAVAVLRYRLWDLDRLVSRTVTYALVTALLVIPYLLVVPTASKLVEGSGSR